jgi:hypothetical protein
MSIRNPVVSEKISPNLSLAVDANLLTSGVSRSQAFLPHIGFALSHCHSFLPRSDVFK